MPDSLEGPKSGPQSVECRGRRDTVCQAFGLMHELSTSQMGSNPSDWWRVRASVQTPDIRCLGVPDTLRTVARIWALPANPACGESDIVLHVRAECHGVR